jgi:hypothetical protein
VSGGLAQCDVVAVHSRGAAAIEHQPREIVTLDREPLTDRRFNQSAVVARGEQDRRATRLIAKQRRVMNFQTPG